VTEIWWSLQALRDLEGIREYIAVDSPRYAGLVVERIIAAVERLRAFPESGRVVPERSAPRFGRLS
jgi:toxin ParE1/3/4